VIEMFHKMHLTKKKKKKNKKPTMWKKKFSYHMCELLECYVDQAASARHD
jgi:hypothetical protein